MLEHFFLLYAQNTTCQLVEEAKLKLEKLQPPPERHLILPRTSGCTAPTVSTNASCKKKQKLANRQACISQRLLI